VGNPAVACYRLPREERTMQTESLWAITSYFNPCRYRSRLENYRIFRDNLRVPLVTAELSYDGRFELFDSDADRVIRLHGRNVMWQKERLLNVALGSLPESCDKVAWLDCDVVIPKLDWVIDAIVELDDHQMIQPFRKVHHLPPDTRVEPATLRELPHIDPVLTEISFASSRNARPETPVVFQPREDRDSRLKVRDCPGLFWAARRELLSDHGLYDACIAGGADKAIALAACGKMHELPEIRPMTPGQIDHYLEWAVRFSASVDNGISHLDYDAYHLWHGHFSDRRYRERHERLVQLEFDPKADLTKDSHGIWCWSNGKIALHEYLKAYFAARREDDRQATCSRERRDSQRASPAASC
jgi:hypothetical protein